MGTRSKTTIFDENNKPLVSIYRQYDGYFDGHGTELQTLLSGMAIVNGYGSNTPAKAANGMGCLAAQIIAAFKDGIGNIYICNHDDEQEYNYEIRIVGSPEWGSPAKVSLIGRGYDEIKTFNLYDEPTVLRRVQFVYDKQTGERIKWREVDVTEEDARYIKGIEVETGAFKCFLRSKILDGKILPA